MNQVLLTLVYSSFLCDPRTSLLLEQLGNDEYVVRETAAAALVRLVKTDHGSTLLPRLQAAAQSSDPEIAWRARNVLAEYYNLRPSRHALLPWIDMLPTTVKERDAVIREYCRRGREAGSPYDAPRWHDYRFATALYVEDLLRSGQTRSQVQKLIDDMADAEMQYKVAHRLPADY